MKVILIRIVTRNTTLYPPLILASSAIFLHSSKLYFFVFNLNDVP